MPAPLSQSALAYTIQYKFVPFPPVRKRFPYLTLCFLSRKPTDGLMFGEMDWTGLDWNGLGAPVFKACLTACLRHQVEHANRTAPFSTKNELEDDHAYGPDERMMATSSLRSWGHAGSRKPPRQRKNAISCPRLTPVSMAQLATQRPPWSVM